MAVVLTTKEMMKVLTMMWDCDNNAVMELRCDGGGDGAGDAERERVKALVTVVLVVLSGDDARIPLH